MNRHSLTGVQSLRGASIVLCFIITLCLASAVGIATAQGDSTTNNQGSYTGSNTGQDLVDLDFLYIGAHPDDEGGFTGTMARYILDEGFKGSVVTYTLGEGGGNATGPELGPALGLIRFEELRRSLATVGVERFYFLGLNDFYYTLSAEETHENWAAQNPDYICDAVRVVRLTQPEVIVSMWPGPGTHGHHQMAARAAILAFNQSGDPAYCSTHISEEFLEPWQPLKLYIAGQDERASLEVPLNDFSREKYMRYADVKALALMNYRSQGWDRFNVIPSERDQPEQRQLVRSLVPVGDPETHLLEGTHVPAGDSPVGIQLALEPESYEAGVGQSLRTTVTFVNDTDSTIEGLTIEASGPEGWNVSGDESSTVDGVAPGEEVRTTFTLEIPDDDQAIRQENLWVSYTGQMDGETISGQNYAWFEVVPPITVAFQPMFDIANYRDFARETNTEWLIPTLATRIPLTIGDATQVTVEVTNAGDSSESGQVEFELPEGVAVEGDREFTVEAGGTVELTVELVVDESVLPEGRHSEALSGTISVSAGGYSSRNEADLYMLPSLDVPRVATAPEIDGDLSDMEELASGRIEHTDRWSGETEGNDDSSADFYVGYDDDNLYVGVRVYDQEVVCHMPPDEIRNHWHADSVELTIDPSGESGNTATTFKAGIFPCTTESFEARAARDADANQGVIEESAPGMRVASQEAADGYTIEASIPWEDMPEAAAHGDSIGFNVLVYDADDADALPGANVGESRIGWASVLGAQQATTYVWPRVELGD